jgi:hypothetical protein
MASYVMLRLVVLVRTDVSEKRSASFIRVRIIGELGTTKAVASNTRSEEEGLGNSSQRESVASYS